MECVPTSVLSVRGDSGSDCSMILWTRLMYSNSSCRSSSTASRKSELSCFDLSATTSLDQRVNWYWVPRSS